MQEQLLIPVGVVVGNIVGGVVGDVVGDALGDTTIRGYLFFNFQDKYAFRINLENKELVCIFFGFVNYPLNFTIRKMMQAYQS